MADEASVRVSLRIKKGNLDYQSRPTDFRADVLNATAPTPGKITVSTTGADVNLSALSAPGGFVAIQNIDGSNYVEWGVHDGAVFHPIGELRPGEATVFRMSRNLGEEENVPGTGTTAAIHTLYLRANTASCIVRVDAFDP